MDRLSMLTVAARVAERGSFTVAARELGISPSKASRVVAQLETKLGVALLQRSTRSVTVTEAGLRFFERCRQALTEIDEAERALKGSRADPSGQLVVTAPVLFGRLLILPVVTELVRRHPAIDVRLLLLDRLTRIVDEGVDVAVRIAELPDSALRAVRVRDAQHVLVASPAYLTRSGAPAAVAELAAHSLVSFEPFVMHGEWRFAGGRSASIRVDPVFASNDMDAVITAAVAGMGIARVFSYQVAAQIGAGDLVTVLDDARPRPVPVNLVYPPHRQGSPAVRAFIDLARTMIE